MTATVYRPSAEIYDIFSGKRLGLLEEQQAMRPYSERPFEHNPNAMAATGWYHEAAVQESYPPRDRSRH